MARVSSPPPLPVPAPTSPLAPSRRPLRARRPPPRPVIAWCSHSGLIPQVLELEILEPLLAAGGSRPVRRTLVYPISVSVALVEQPMGAGDPPVLPEAEGDRRGRRRWRQDRSPRAPPARAASVEPRASVHARLGPLPVVRGHVVDAPSPA